MLLITPTERDALRLLSQDRATREIAHCLGVDAAAVEPYLTCLFSKMGVSNRTEAVMSALQRGLLAPDIEREP